MKPKTPRRWYKHKDGDSEEGLGYLYTREVIREAEAGGTEDTGESNHTGEVDQSALEMRGSKGQCKTQETTNYQNETGNEYQTEETQEEMQSKAKFNKN